MSIQKGGKRKIKPKVVVRTENIFDKEVEKKKKRERENRFVEFADPSICQILWH